MSSAHIYERWVSLTLLARLPKSIPTTLAILYYYLEVVRVRPSGGGSRWGVQFIRWGGQGQDLNFLSTDIT